MQAEFPAVQANGLCRRYGRAWALIDVDLEVPAGKALLVAGRNGSGKSTLLRVLAGALKPDRGSYRICGHDGVLDRQRARANVGLLGHHSNTWDALSALQNLQVTARFLGKAAGRRDLMPLLEEVGLAERADSPITSFSAGMRKRIAFARLLLQEPKVVLLDEPYGQLDPPGFAFVDALVPRLKERGCAVIVASHMLEKSADLCDLGIALERGHVIYRGTAAGLPAAFTAHHAPQQRLEAVR